MLNWIVMDVVDVSLKVSFVSQDVVPKPVLPYTPRSAEISEFSAICYFEQVYALRQPLVLRINNYMKMVGENNPRYWLIV